MMAFVEAEGASTPAADHMIAASGSHSSEPHSGPGVHEETSTRPDGSVVHTRVERHEEFRVVGPDGDVTVYDTWEDLPAEIRSAYKKSAGAPVGGREG